MNKKNHHLAVISACIAVILLSGCIPAVNPTPIPGLANTLAVRTIVAQQGLEYIATFTPTAAPTMTPLFESSLYASNVIATETPSPSSLPSLTPWAQLNQLSSNETCKNRAAFISDISIEDNARIKPGQSFRKIWKIQNIGTCTWSPDFALVFTFGDRMGGVSPMPIGVEVKPGEMVNLGIDLVAPRNSDYFQGNWMLQDDQGELFGTGDGKRDFFWVAIVVGSGKDPLEKIFGGICGGGG